MKASTVIALAAATFVSAQGLDSIPPCALSCAISSLGSTGCATTDIACICQATAFVTSLVPCVQGACSAEQFDATVQAAGALCQAAGVTLTIPTATSAPSSTSSVVSTASSTTVSTVTSVSVVPTTTEVSTTMLTTTASNATVTSTPSGNSSVTQPPAPTGTDDSAAGRNAVAIGGLGAIAALVAALL